MFSTSIFAVDGLKSLLQLGYILSGTKIPIIFAINAKTPDDFQWCLAYKSNIVLLRKDGSFKLASKDISKSPSDSQSCVNLVNKYIAIFPEPEGSAIFQGIFNETAIINSGTDPTIRNINIISSKSGRKLFSYSYVKNPLDKNSDTLLPLRITKGYLEFFHPTRTVIGREPCSSAQAQKLKQQGFDTYYAQLVRVNLKTLRFNAMQAYACYAN